MLIQFLVMFTEKNHNDMTHRYFTPCTASVYACMKCPMTNIDTAIMKKMKQYTKNISAFFLFHPFPFVMSATRPNIKFRPNRKIIAMIKSFIGIKKLNIAVIAARKNPFICTITLLFPQIFVALYRCMDFPRVHLQ